MEEKIALYMKNLDISREEAIQLINDDAEDVSVDLTPEQAKVVSDVTRTTGDKTERKARQRKPDNDKRFLIRILETAIGYNPQVSNFELLNPEREIQFEFRGALYKLTLSKPRTK